MEKTMVRQAPTWAKDAILTTRGWRTANGKELLVSMKVPQAEVDEWNGIQKSEEAPTVEDESAKKPAKKRTGTKRKTVKRKTSTKKTPAKKAVTTTKKEDLEENSAADLAVAIIAGAMRAMLEKDDDGEKSFF